MRLYPRLHLSHANAIASSFVGSEPNVLRARDIPSLSGQRFAPTGGRRITDAEMFGLRRDLETIADSVGFPTDTLATRQQFDRQIAKFLGGADFPPGEMLRAQTWAWMAVYLVPHLVQWRFGGAERTASVERFAGSLQRNAIGRLWFRGWVFDRGSQHAGRFDVVDRLTEDASVAILERTTIASHHRLAQALAHGWLQHRDHAPSQAEELLREAAKRIRVLAVVRDLAVLDHKEVDTVVERVIVETAATLHGNGNRRGAYSA
jgi:hypothetical protein